MINIPNIGRVSCLISWYEHVIFHTEFLILAYVRLTLRLLVSYIYGAPNKARNANVVYIWT